MEGEETKTAGLWGPKDVSDPNCTVNWASERPVYEWEDEYTDATAPANEELEKELFSEENRIYQGIHFEKYIKAAVSVKGGPNDRQPMEKFEDTAFHPTVAENIKRMEYKDPTPIQKHGTPLIMAGYDLLACAQTGSGKTAAFLVPILSKLLFKLKTSAAKQPGARRTKPAPLALIILPTRELGIQMFDEARRFTYKSRLRPVVIYGGAELRTQRDQLAKGCDILIATPGRLVDALHRGYVSLSRVKHVVLDEADRILDMGFEPLVREILMCSELSREESLQTIMLSATFPRDIQVLAREFLKDDYVRLRIGRIGGTTSDITQKVLKIEQHDKENQIIQLLLSQPPSRTMIFVDTKRRADYLDDILYNLHFPCVSLHGDRNQVERELAIEAFRHGKSPILITTSVASRGLDIKDVLHVVNYDMCSDIDEYVHRIGRTGRAGNPGLATTFFNDRNIGLAPQLLRILKECQQEVPGFLQDLVAEDTFYDQVGQEDFVEDEEDAAPAPAATGGNESNDDSPGWSASAAGNSENKPGWGASIGDGWYTGQI
ncbi:hypothetical protein BGX28_003093 [Mortierella sp. GBA30]|nr:hypothetical protein BGX28_003093 [Mortierella sp. GBA30]